MGGFRLNRKQKIVRNLLVCLLLAAATYAALGFPPYTVRGMLERTERRYLLSDLEPLLVKRERIDYSNELLDTHETYLLAKTGNTYIFTKYTRHFLAVEPGYSDKLKMGRDFLCAAQGGCLYLAGEFPDDASAVMRVTAEKREMYYDRDRKLLGIERGPARTFTYQGERLGEELFEFRYMEEDDFSWALPDLPESEYHLGQTAREWYSSYMEGIDGRGVDHADLPVTVTLYNGEGEVLDTLDFTISNYELFL